MKRKLRNLVPLLLVLLLVILISLIPFTAAHADVAPPQTPPGSNLNPGDEITQVRMVAETVLLTIRQDPQDEAGAVADTVATFTMRNTGTEDEKMQARFPLSFVGGNSDGFGNFPEISQIAIEVNDKPVATDRVMQPALSIQYSTHERDEVPWAVFDVNFPPGQDVKIVVTYTVRGYGYYPYEIFQYILETGAGWNDTIGSADIIVRLPYQTNASNIWLSDDVTGFSQTSTDAVLSGHEVRWHFENLEPTHESNIAIELVSPALWQPVLREMDTVSKDPNDGEAWGRLGKAYKEVAILSKHGNPRTDAGGRELLALSQQAYEKCLALLPNDSLWHFGYADLLWSHYYFDVFLTGNRDPESLLPRVLNELRTALDLDPNNQRAKDLLSWISSSIPGSVAISDSGYDFLALTATPIPPTQFVSVTQTSIVDPTAETNSSPTLPPGVQLLPRQTDRPVVLPFVVELHYWWRSWLACYCGPGGKAQSGSPIK